MPFSHDHVRLVIDEDLPATVAEHLRLRGYIAESLQESEIRERILDRRAGGHADTRISDAEVAEETGRVPSVLVTLNLRDYSDPRQHEELVEQHDISVVQIRVPKSESEAGARPAAIHDIVHRWAHRFVALQEGPPTVASVSRGGIRRRTLDEIHRERADRDEANERKRAEIRARVAEQRPPNARAKKSTHKRSPPSNAPPLFEDDG